MHVVMDADCLIKLTKAQLKESVCAAFTVSLPTAVMGEIMANAAAHPECVMIQRNLDAGLLAEIKDSRSHAKGDDALLEAYGRGPYAAIASDDKRLARKMRLLGLPYITPAVMLLVMVNRKRLSVEEGLSALQRLAPMVSDAEVAIVKLKLESMRNRI
jgi:rRNA-processing protein FCF1